MCQKSIKTSWWNGLRSALSKYQHAGLYDFIKNQILEKLKQERSYFSLPISAFNFHCKPWYRLFRKMFWKRQTLSEVLFLIINSQNYRLIAKKFILPFTARVVFVYGDSSTSYDLWVTFGTKGYDQRGDMMVMVSKPK